MPSAFEKKRSEKYSFYDYVDITIDMHFQHPEPPLFSSHPKLGIFFCHFAWFSAQAKELTI